MLHAFLYSTDEDQVYKCTSEEQHSKPAYFLLHFSFASNYKNRVWRNEVVISEGCDAGADDGCAGDDEEAGARYLRDGGRAAGDPPRQQQNQTRVTDVPTMQHM